MSARGRGPVLVACAHGTASAVGREAVAGMLDDVRALRPGLEVRAAFVDVQEPVVADVVRHVLADGARAVVVPVLLSPGFHTAVDVAAAVGVPGAVATPSLGPDRLLVQILVDRIRESGAGPDDAVVLAAAGSSDPRAAAAARRTAAMLDEALREEAPREADAPARVSVGYGTAVAPAVSEAVSAA
ncbi:MAG: sirohydrochlorin chelatase, partial [Cellulomonadaceae bacterium]